jgi:hypothetical protein
MLPSDCLEKGVYPQIALVKVFVPDEIVERVKFINQTSSELDSFRHIARKGSDSRWTL